MATSEEEWRARYTFGDVLGGSAALRQAVALGRRAAASGYPTLLVGESGTGKELLSVLLRFLETGEFIRVRGTRPVRSCIARARVAA